MTVNQLKIQIENYATGQNLTYIRGTEIEANFKLDDVDTTKRAMIHFDQSEINSTVSKGSLVVLEVPTQILFLQIDPESDSDLDTIDDNVENCEKDALKFYDYILQNSTISTLVDIPGPSLERLPAFKRFDSAFSGVLLNCIIPILSTEHLCPAGALGFPYTFPYVLS
jgi:hypothetical protein